MEFDPLSRDVPPSRHDVESDSEGSEDEEQLHQRSSTGEGSNRTKKSFVPPSFTLKGNTKDASISPSLPLTVFIGTSGEAFVRSNAQFTESFVLLNSDNGEQQGALDHSKSATYALIRPDADTSAQQATLTYLASYLTETLRPSSVTIVDEYYPALYLSDTERDYGEAQPIRVLNAGQPALQSTKAIKSVQPFVAPNYITGLGAALLAHAASINTPASLVSAPQEKSVNPHLQTLQRVPNASSSVSDRPEALDALLSQELASLLSIQAPKQQKPTTTTARSLDTFLNERRTRERKKQQNEISAMYM
ncbi:uncharacterized protein FA14DRAFT_85317 [Meira miltonrushii]|uniref:Proteasome assembly chaperone 1 n=1 Tax=Meira miltonrushii TaxID=1280837 RepID=A0A316V3L6_9BASI|nr:uncharacterized protein FA14DRAFT_85317 [Meira miltonrushii]PWN32149.1 hypothetical protein FA14DRAFT_85317 [Meira miltonrushii]